ncbi:Kinesin-like protein [Quillaja saponaria]|uniref:Kinesin-like protein n=1 Tax=Quillaja saponaria TaxID=32244 RepID=A0AAD7VJB1_QUISA|nr:Kinesin-like protein [Quillaja saponaria]KAJ7978022.1 Kinesin-like protein [Quillaja saponaria]
MLNITVCARFRPLNSKERRNHNDSVCIRRTDSESFILKDEKEDDFTFSFDRVFYEESKQADVYKFLALPIVRDAVNAINGTIITYGQTGAGKTYSMEGPGILECDEQKKGLLSRAVYGLFDSIKSSDEAIKHTIKLSMVEIYMEKVRDLFDLSKDNIQIKESKLQGIILPRVTEITVLDPAEALQSLSSGIANRAVGETQMNMASSRSHCVYIFTIHQELHKDRRVKSGKLILVDLAGSEKVEKTGAEGRVLEEAKTINKSLSALGNVVNAVTCGLQGKLNHIPYRDSKLTRILQDALGGNSRTALLCCCSPSTSNVSESLSTLRFGARAKHIKTSPCVNNSEDECGRKLRTPSPTKDESCDRILNKLKERLNVGDVKLLEELLILEGIIFNPHLDEEMESACEDLTLQTIASLEQAMEELLSTVEELKKENSALKAKIVAAEKSDALYEEAGKASSFVETISGMITFFRCWLGHSCDKMLEWES